MGHPLQIIRVKKVTGNLNFLWLINTPYSKMLATIGPVYREVEDFCRWGNPLRWDNPRVHVISHFNLNQELIFEGFNGVNRSRKNWKILIFNFFVNRNWKKLTGSGKRARILADNRKSHHPIETLISRNEQLPRRFHGPVSFQNGFCANLEYRLSPPNQSAKSTDLKKT